MAEIKETIGDESARSVVLDAANCICRRAQLLFTNRLTVNFYDGDTDGAMGPPQGFYVSENYWTFLFGILPWKKSRDLFFIQLFYGNIGAKEVNCSVFSSRVLDIAIDEMQKCADVLCATGVNLRRSFVN